MSAPVIRRSARIAAAAPAAAAAAAPAADAAPAAAPAPAADAAPVLNRTRRIKKAPPASNSNNSNNSERSGPPVARSLTGISSLLQTPLEAKIRKKFKKTRKAYEKQEVSFQCEKVLGEFNGSQLCWLCGFPINKWNELEEEYPTVVKVVKPLLDRDVCEHVFPVKLAYAILELLNLEVLERDASLVNKTLLHTEYEYAHNHCNYIKNDDYFVTLPLPAENLCGLNINEETIDRVLYRIFFDERDGKQSSVVYVQSAEDPTLRIRFPNPVQAYCYSNLGEAFLDEKVKLDYYEKKWKPFAKRTIIAKTNRVIQYIKNKDFCGEENNVTKRGSFYKSAKERLTTGAVPLSKSASKYNVPLVARTGSTTGIISANRNRLVPFTERFRGFYPAVSNSEGSVRTGDPSNSNTEPGSPGSSGRASPSNLNRAGAGAPAVKSPAERAVEAAIEARKALNAAGAGAGP